MLQRCWQAAQLETWQQGPAAASSLVDQKEQQGPAAECGLVDQKEQQGPAAESGLVDQQAIAVGRLDSDLPMAAVAADAAESGLMDQAKVAVPVAAGLLD